MPIRTLRLFIETVLPHSPMTKVSLFDSTDRLLKDSDRLRSLKRICSSSHHIPIRFTLINPVTSLANCSCLSPPIENNLSSSPTIIQEEKIEQILSTCSFTHPNAAPIPTKIVNLLTLPSFPINFYPDEAMMNHIPAEFGEICPPLPNQYCISKKMTHHISSDFPLDLSLKKHPISTQTNWIKT